MKKLNIGLLGPVLLVLVCVVAGSAIVYGLVSKKISLGTGQRLTASVITSFISTNSFAVLAGSAITNTGSTVITGDIGSFPTASISGFPPGTLTAGSTNHGGDGVTQQGKTDLAAAYNYAAGQTPTQDLTGQDLGGLALTPGVYSFSSSAQLTGPLTLNGSGTYIFQIGTTLTTASASSVVLAGGADVCDIFWQVGSSATLGTGTIFKGTIMAAQSVTLTTGATVDGRVLAQNGAVTLDSNTITASTCGGSPPTPTVATLTLVKTVSNTHGGTKSVSDFPLFINGLSMTSGVATTTLSPGTYTASETSATGYTASFWGGDCSTDGTVTLAGGANKTCTLTNSDILVPAVNSNKGSTHGSYSQEISSSTTATTATAATVPITTAVAPSDPSPTPTPVLPNTGFGPRE